jgi:hypothetical protein
MDVPTLSNEEALELTRRGASILALGLPTGREFGVDLRSYTVGEAAACLYSRPRLPHWSAQQAAHRDPGRAPTRPCLLTHAARRLVSRQAIGSSA